MSVVDLASLGSEGFLLQGANAFDRAGFSVAIVGDVNGDGFDDILVGAPSNDEGGTDAGAAYVIFGGANGFDTIDLQNLQGSAGYRIVGADPFDRLGMSVSSAGDINGDGFGDIIIGAAEGPFFYSTVPTAYVLFGKANGFSTVDLTNLSGSDGFRIAGSPLYAYTHLSVASAGDINGDGFDDLIVGSPYSNSYSGTAYVIFGKATGLGPISLGNLPLSSGFGILGSGGERAGYSVSGAGDVNGDGFADIIVGSFLGDAGGDNAGQAYVIFGKANGFSTVTLSSLGSAGFLIQGDAAGDFAGIDVSAAGDVNGDGYDDVIVGAKLGDLGGAQAGQAYVIFGKATGFTTVDLGNLAATAGFLIRGGAAGDLVGYSVSGAGDVNNDGFDDLLVGAPTADNAGGTDAGEAYVILGRATGFGTIDLANLAPADGFVIQGDSAFDNAGWSVSGGGDINNDGHADVIIGAPFVDFGGETAGEAYVISGSLNLILDAVNDFNGDGRSDIAWRHDDGRLSEWLGTPSGGFQDNAAIASATVPASWQVAGFGDFNGDGRDDILWRNADGRIADWLGQASGGFTDNGAAGSTAVPTQWHVAGIGDFNGDGRDDILWRHDDGRMSNWLALPNGGFQDNAANAFIAVPVDWHVAGVGDFNGDGRDDILWRNDDGRTSNWLGLSNGGYLDNAANAFTTVPLTWQVAGVGDFNGDGRDDILWRNATGMIAEWLGLQNGGYQDIGAIGSTFVPLQWKVAQIGDFNGDGREDVLWRHDDGRLTDWLGLANGGFFDNAANGLTTVPTTWHVQGDTLL